MVLLCCLFPSVLWKGWKKALEMSDLTDLNEEDKAKVVTTSFNKNWSEELLKAKSVYAGIF